MSSESENEEQFRSNYFNLRYFFDDDCTQLLRNVLNEYFPIYTYLLEKISRDSKNAERSNIHFTEGELELIKKENNISKMFKFELIDKIFRTGVCDEFCGGPSVGWNSHGETSLSYQNSGDGFLQLFNIWRQYISKNDQEEISDSENKKVRSILREVTHHLKQDFPDFENRFLKKKPIDESETTTVNTQIGSSNLFVSSENSTGTIVSNQIGQENIFSSQNAVQRAPTTFICNQEGYDCKIAITLNDQTRGNVNLGIAASGKVRITLHSSDPCYGEIADRVANLSVEEINEDRCLQENCIEVLSTEKACVIVDVRITNSNVDVSASMQYLVEYLMKQSDAFQLLCDNKVAVLNVFGYFYQPYEYIDSSDLRLKFSMFRHVTLKFEKTICDVDVFVSDCLKKLIENSFKTNVDERIRMQMKGEIIVPRSQKFTELLKLVIDYEEDLRSMFKSMDSKCLISHLQIEDKIRQKSAIDVLVKTTASFTYGTLLEKDGPIVDLLRKILKLDAVAEMLSDTFYLRICVLLNTSMDDECSADPERGIVYSLSSGSKILEVIENDKLPEVIQAMLGIKNTKGIEQLKVKAVLENNNGKTDECGTSSQEEDITYNAELGRSDLESKHLLDVNEVLGNFHEVAQTHQAVSHEFDDFQVSTPLKCVREGNKSFPRYKYHRSLLDWFVEGLPQDPIFNECCYSDCSIIIGGDICEQKMLTYFGENLSFEALDSTNLDADDCLIVYFFTNNVSKMRRRICEIVGDFTSNLNRTVLIVLTTDNYDNERLRSVLIEEVSKLGMSDIKFAIETRSEIINTATCILEKRLYDHLQLSKKMLREYSHSHSVWSNMLEVNAILRRIKPAAGFAEVLSEEEDDDSDYFEIEQLLQSFKDNILYHEFYDDTLYIVTTDHKVKEGLETWYSLSHIKNLHLVITVEDKLKISEFSRTGEPLHGAKLVFVNEGAKAFLNDNAFATSGSLMLANDEKMVAITSLHAIDKTDSLYTLIDGSVEILGKEIPQINNKLERIHDDIALILIDEKTREIVDKKCEKLLIDGNGQPTPAKISSHSLNVGDIVHKRGARTGLTTGVVQSISNICIGCFSSPSLVLLITGGGSRPFADKGDSGSLVFQKCFNLDEEVIKVYAMVHSKILAPTPNGAIICFPLKDGCESLKKHIPDIQSLRFF